MTKTKNSQLVTLPEGLEGLRLPNLYLIGAMKSGTTTLAGHLVQSPDVAYYAGKEPHLFNQPDMERVIKRIRNQYQGDPRTKYVLDGTPNYTRVPHDDIPQRIKSLASSDSRFIYIIRNPVERAISHYFWNRERSGESLPFLEAMEVDPSYTDAGLYDVQIDRYFAEFDPSRFHFVKFESMINAPEVTVNALLVSLEAHPAEAIDPKAKGSSTNRHKTREAFAPSLMSVFRRNRWAVDFAKSFIPERHHVAIMHKLTREVARQEIPEDQKAEVHKRFTESIVRTQTLTGLDLSEWHIDS